MTDGRGLFLWVTPSGGKLWRWKYRLKGVGKQMSYGQYPDVSLLDARERHAEARKLLAAGVDPMAKRKADRAALMASDSNSFQAVAHLWLEHWRSGITERHAETTRRRLEANVYPLLGTRPIAEIEAPEIVTMVKTIESRGAAVDPLRPPRFSGTCKQYHRPVFAARVALNPGDGLQLGILPPRNSRP
jgi:hypothetical protein